MEGHSAPLNQNHPTTFFSLPFHHPLSRFLQFITKSLISLHFNSSHPGSHLLYLRLYVAWTRCTTGWYQHQWFFCGKASTVGSSFVLLFFGSHFLLHISGPPNPNYATRGSLAHWKPLQLENITPHIRDNGWWGVTNRRGRMPQTLWLGGCW